MTNVNRPGDVAVQEILNQRINVVKNELFSRSAVVFEAERDGSGYYFIRGRIMWAVAGDTKPIGVRKSLNGYISLEAVRQVMSYIVKVLTGDNPDKMSLKEQSPLYSGKSYFPDSDTERPALSPKNVGYWQQWFMDIRRDTGVIINMRNLDFGMARAVAIDGFVPNPTGPNQAETVTIDGNSQEGYVRDVVMALVDKIRTRRDFIDPRAQPWLPDRFPDQYPKAPQPMTNSLDAIQTEWAKIAIERTALAQQRQDLERWYRELQQQAATWVTNGKQESITSPDIAPTCRAITIED